MGFPKFLLRPHRCHGGLLRALDARRNIPELVRVRIHETVARRNIAVEIIGVVADVRTESLEKQPPLMVYVPYWDGVY